MNPVRRAGRAVRRGARVVRGRLLLARGVEPASRSFGAERGKPIHRAYIDEFFEAHGHRIGGRCMEFHDAGYLGGFSGGRATTIDVVDLDPDNPDATIVADLTKPNTLEAGRFDCIVCVHVLHLVYEADVFTRELHRLLAPGGTLFVAVPATSMIDPEWTEFRRWTGLGVRTLLEQFFAPEAVLVEAYGNSLAAAAEMRGLASDEIAPTELRARDDRFPVEVCALATKSDA